MTFLIALGMLAFPAFALVVAHRESRYRRAEREWSPQRRALEALAYPISPVPSPGLTATARAERTTRPGLAYVGHFQARASGPARQALKRKTSPAVWAGDARTAE